MSGQRAPASDVEVALDIRADLGEGPVWDGRIGSIVWVDIPRGKVLIFDPRCRSLREFDVGQPVGAVAPRVAGGYALAVRDGFATLDAATGAVELIAPVEQNDLKGRMNDGSCDLNGRFWAGTMAEEETPRAGSLYRLDPNGSVTRILGDVTISNGIDWSLDGRLMYYIDTATQGIDVFDFDAEGGAVSGRRQLIAVEPDAGAPDGLTVDAEGSLWVALWGGAAVRRYAPDGALDRVVGLPATLITSVAFGGDDLDELYVSSARAYLSAHEQAEQPHAGKLFRLDPGVRGRPANGFSG
jgi:sugar lactone lactonase YvrE